MKNKINIFKIASIVIINLVMISCNSKDKRPLLGDTPYQQRLNSSFKDATSSPLKKRDLKEFEGLQFFPVDSNFIVTAKLTRIENAPIFKMPTTTDRAPLYKEFGILDFIINNKSLQLTVYQNQEDLEDEQYKDYLFIPFTDETSGNESYGGGRYMDVMLSDITSEDTIELNFNNTYNPYCAYNEKFSCPITPRKNHLDIEIKAGIQDFKKH